MGVVTLLTLKANIFENSVLWAGRSEGRTAGNDKKMVLDCIY